MDTFQQQKQKTLQLFQSAVSLAQTLKNRESEQSLKAAASHLEEGKLVVVVAGEFKQGKSSLMNALLNESGFFPVDIDIATCLVSSITYGDQEKITVLLGEPGQEKQKQIRREEIPDYVTEQRNANNAKKARLLVIETPNPQLKDGLVLVDTPGVGGLNLHHTEATYSFLPNADAVLFVSDVLKPLTTVELEFIRERIARHCPTLLFVLTKIDAVPDYSAVLESNREKLAETLQRTPEDILILPVSSRLKQEYLKSGYLEDLEDSRFEALEAELWKMLKERRGKILLMSALNELGLTVAEMKRPLEAEFDALQKHTKEELDAMERKAQAASDRQRALTGPDAPWRILMRDGILDVRTQIPALFQEGIVQARRQAERYLDDPQMLAVPETLVGKVEIDLDVLMTEMSSHIDRMAEELTDRIQRSLGIGFDHFRAGGLELEREDISDRLARIPKPSLWEKGMQIVRQTASQSSLLTTIVSIFAIPLNPVLASLGIASVLAANTKVAMEKIQEKNRTDLGRVLNEFIDDAQRRGNKLLLDVITRMERALRDETETQIKREREACDSTVQSIKSARRLSEEQAGRRAAELKGLLQPLTQLQERIADLVRQALLASE